MKKTLIHFFIITAIISIIFSCEKKDDPSFPFRLKTKILYTNGIPDYKYSYTYSNDKIDTIIYKIYSNASPGIITEIYNYQGNTIKRLNYQMVGNMVKYKIEDTYLFESADLIQYNNIHYSNEDGKLSEIISEYVNIKYNYDGDRLANVEFYENNEVDKKCVFTYIGNTEVIRYYSLNYENVFEERERVDKVYNNNQRIEFRRYDIQDGEEVLIYSHKYQYDNHGNMVQIDYLNSRNEIEQTIITHNEYDEFGNLIRSYEEGSNSEYRYTYEPGSSNLDKFDLPADTYYEILYY